MCLESKINNDGTAAQLSQNAWVRLGETFYYAKTKVITLRVCFYLKINICLDTLVLPASVLARPIQRSIQLQRTLCIHVN